LKLDDLPTGVTDWSLVPSTEQEHAGHRAIVRALQLGNIQLRLVEFSPGFHTERWCPKGHLIFVLSGELIVEHQDGRRFRVVGGMTYHVADDAGAPHRAFSDEGAKFFIVD
jgi:quercetin dioxygenase-like cupin family protein